MADPDLAWQQDQLKKCVKFEGEAYLKGHLDVYMQLPERGAAELLYRAYHRILDDNDDRMTLHTNTYRAKRLLARLVERNQLQRKYIRKFLGRAEAEELLKKLTATTEPKDRK